MSVQLNPDIAGLDPQSLCYTIYTQLYQNFFNAQDAGAVSEGDDTSIRLHNTAYDFAAAIAGAVSGDGDTGGGGVLLEYLRKSGGDMTGLLRAQYGFEAGIGNTRVVDIFSESRADESGEVISTVYGVTITGDLRLGGNSLRLDGHTAVSYCTKDGTLRLDAAHVDLGAGAITSTGEFFLGPDKAHGLYFSPSTIQFHGHDVYHTGSANLPSVDWAMRNGTVAGDLTIAGITEHAGLFRALHGVELGAAGVAVARVYPAELALAGNLSFAAGYGIRIGGRDVLVRSGAQDIMLGAPGGDLLLGSEMTNKIRLQSGIADTDGEHVLLSRYGAAYFPASLTVRHNYGADLLASYRVDDADEGMVVNKRLRFGTNTGCYLHGTSEGLCFTSETESVSNEGILRTVHTTQFLHRPSTSVHASQNRTSESFALTTDADYLTVDAPLEARGHVGIDASPTRLTNGRLDLAEGRYLLSVNNGIKHFGRSYFTDGAGSEFFSSGFAGSGWEVSKNKTSGSITATFDEVVVRRRMRVYEMEVQRSAVTNGSLWVSDFCIGDSVEEI